MAEFFEDIAQAIAIVTVRFGFDQPIKDFSAREIAYSLANERKLNGTRKNPITMPEEGHISTALQNESIRHILSKHNDYINKIQFKRTQLNKKNIYKVHFLHIKESDDPHKEIIKLKNYISEKLQLQLVKKYNLTPTSLIVTMQANTTEHERIADHYSDSSQRDIVQDDDDDNANVYDLSIHNLQKILDTHPKSETTRKRGKPSLAVTMTIEELIADRRKKQNQVSMLKKRCREQETEIKELKDKKDEVLVGNDKNARTMHEIRVSEEISAALIKLASK